MLDRILVGVWIKQRTKISVSEARQEEFSLSDGLAHGCVGGFGEMERPIGPAVANDGSSEAIQHSFGRDRIADDR